MSPDTYVPRISRNRRLQAREPYTTTVVRSFPWQTWTFALAGTGEPCPAGAEADGVQLGRRRRRKLPPGSKSPAAGFITRANFRHRECVLANAITACADKLVECSYAASLGRPPNDTV
jgi:hypothetical protein